MKKWLKIVLIVLAAIIVLVAALAVYGYYAYRDVFKEAGTLKSQVDDVNNLVNNPEFKQNFEDLAKGDCSKLPVVKEQFAELKARMKAVCSNEIAASNPNVTAACAEITSPNNQMDAILAQIETACAAQAGAS